MVEDQIGSSEDFVPKFVAVYFLSQSRGSNCMWFEAYGLERGSFFYAFNINRLSDHVHMICFCRKLLLSLFLPLPHQEFNDNGPLLCFDMNGVHSITNLSDILPPHNQIILIDWD